jgi:hypothetical protein
MLPAKTHHTVVAIVPPEGVWEPIQAIRRRHDRQVHRWMPHCNLLYPFRHQEEFPATLPALRGACASIAPFTVSLGKFRHFRHSSGRCTLWLAPEPAEVLQRLQAALQAAFPDCDDLIRGQFPSPRDCERTRQQLQAGWQPVPFALSEVTLLARERGGAFSIAQRVALRESGAFAPSLGG